MNARALQRHPASRRGVVRRAAALIETPSGPVPPVLPWAAVSRLQLAAASPPTHRGRDNNSFRRLQVRSPRAVRPRGEKPRGGRRFSRGFLWLGEIWLLSVNGPVTRRARAPVARAQRALPCVLMSFRSRQ